MEYLELPSFAIRKENHDQGKWSEDIYQIAIGAAIWTTLYMLVRQFNFQSLMIGK
jgi:hypothetical protein